MIFQTLMRALCLAICASGLAIGQAVDIPLILSNDVGDERELRFGLDPTATDGIDEHLGEAELPPFPPSAVFEARFAGADIGIPEMGLGTYRDYRQGTADFQGEIVHQLHYQVGDGASITVSWNLPDGITGRLQDFVTGELIDESMTGSGSFTVTNPSSFNKLKMTVTYGGGVSTEPPIGEDTFNVVGVAPNPSHSAPTLIMEVPRRGMVSVTIYDSAGRYLTSIDAPVEVGTNVPVSLRGARLAAGAYVYSVSYRSGEIEHSAGGRFTVIR